MNNFLDFEHFGEGLEVLLILGYGDFVNCLVEAKCFDRGEIPPELVFLTHDERDLLEEGWFALERGVAEDFDSARAGIE